MTVLVSHFFKMKLWLMLKLLLVGGALCMCYLLYTGNLVHFDFTIDNSRTDDKFDWEGPSRGTHLGHSVAEDQLTHLESIASEDQDTDLESIVAEDEHTDLWLRVSEHKDTHLQSIVADNLDIDLWPNVSEDRGTHVESIVAKDQYADLWETVTKDQYTQIAHLAPSVAEAQDTHLAPSVAEAQDTHLVPSVAEAQDTHLVPSVAARQHSVHLPDQIVFVIIVCKGKNGVFARLADQVKTLVKSAAALTATRLRFVVVTDTKKLYFEVASSTKDWPQEYKDKVTFQYMPESYPKGREKLRRLGQLCVTERLFLPPMLPQYDTAIYIDTDFIFLRPPEHLWILFKDFDTQQLAGMAAAHKSYSTRSSKTPYFGYHGLNGGLIMMNLTRIRSIPGGWVRETLYWYDKYSRRLEKADQGILNIMFGSKPHWMHQIGCEWNFRMVECSGGRTMCPVVRRGGASLLHGSSGSFAKNSGSLNLVYQSWRDYRIGTPLRLLYQDMMARLSRVAPSRADCISLCEVQNIYGHHLLQRILKDNSSVIENIQCPIH